jgi:hypothetical protein
VMGGLLDRPGWNANLTAKHSMEWDYCQIHSSNGTFCEAMRFPASTGCFLARLSWLKQARRYWLGHANREIGVRWRRVGSNLIPRACL